MVWLQLWRVCCLMYGWPRYVACKDCVQHVCLQRNTISRCLHRLGSLLQHWRYHWRLPWRLFASTSRSFGATSRQHEEGKEALLLWSNSSQKTTKSTRYWNTNDAEGDCRPQAPHGETFADSRIRNTCLDTWFAIQMIVIKDEIMIKKMYVDLYPKHNYGRSPTSEFRKHT